MALRALMPVAGRTWPQLVSLRSSHLNLRSHIRPPYLPAAEWVVSFTETAFCRYSQRHLTASKNHYIYSPRRQCDNAGSPSTLSLSMHYSKAHSPGTQSPSTLSPNQQRPRINSSKTHCTKSHSLSAKLLTPHSATPHSPITYSSNLHSPITYLPRQYSPSTQCTRQHSPSTQYPRKHSPSTQCTRQHSPSTECTRQHSPSRYSSSIHTTKLCFLGTHLLNSHTLNTQSVRYQSSSSNQYPSSDTNQQSSSKHSPKTHSPSTHSPSTVYALSSGRGRCGVAVVRVSGPQAGTVLLRMGHFSRLPTPRLTVLRRLHHPDTGRVLDKALVVWFPGPASFTGEDSCELHVHGGAAVVAAVLEALQALPGLEPAEPGDFTRRAFSNGKLDLTEVEGLADLIHAETEAQRQQALRQMEGDLSELYGDWRQRLVKCAAHVAAFIDFSEDELIEDDVLNQVTDMAQQLRDELRSHLDDHRRGERLRDGVHVAIVGEPNVGKSSLLNALCRRPAAIVSPQAGTTRDVVESAVNLGGYPVLLSDTAGLRAAEDVVEREGVRRAKLRARTADLRVVVVDARHLLPPGGMQPQPARFLQLHLEALGLTKPAGGDQEESGDREWDGPLLVVVNKTDLVRAGQLTDVLRVAAGSEGNSRWAAVSCMTGEGLDDFLNLLTNCVKDLCGNPEVGNPSLTQARHRTHLSACFKALDSYLQVYNRDLVVGGEYLRQATYQVGKLTGRITSDEVLDVVFRDFCIGK